MTTWSRKRKPDLFGRPKWHKDNSSKFECDSPPGSPVLVLDYKSVIFKDLDLYEVRYVCKSLLKLMG